MKLRVYNAKLNLREKLPKITVHGRFQPPLHINHWNYISSAFKLAQNVVILITNPYLNEASVKENNNRNKKQNNPFTFNQRKQIFEQFFSKMGISKDRYEFKPFNITQESAWRELDKEVPNLVNTYGDWSRAKLQKFLNLGFKVIRSNKHKDVNVSGTKIRKVLQLDLPIEQKKLRLAAIDYMPQAIEGLFKVLK